MSGDAAPRLFGEAADPALLRCQKFTSRQIAFIDSRIGTVPRRFVAGRRLAAPRRRTRFHRLCESSIAASGFINEDE